MNDECLTPREKNEIIASLRLGATLVLPSAAAHIQECNDCMGQLSLQTGYTNSDILDKIAHPSVTEPTMPYSPPARLSVN